MYVEYVQHVTCLKGVAVAFNFQFWVCVNEVCVHGITKYIWFCHLHCLHYKVLNQKLWICKSLLYNGNKITGQCQNLETPWPRASLKGDNLLVEVLQVHKVSLFIVNGASPGFVTWWHHIREPWFPGFNFRGVFKHITKNIEILSTRITWELCLCVCGFAKLNLISFSPSSRSS